ncbi:hypothetical protein BCR42DRAFT_227467 [Absidia repens]|uniref:BZIP domain-containing protein n=1 Tax=Absidia repens TaxID=90262 RepID=A0A1X2IKZ7_9FUNG|nr:hypothetical protein BCR42DRAFT_227467 [Absidia repens]
MFCGSSFGCGYHHSPSSSHFPTTEQIKQLIELAKHQLALRASQTNGNNNSVNNTNSASCSSSNQDVPIKSETASSSTTSSSGAAVSSSDSSTSPSASHLAAHLANTNLFGNSSNLPDTVSPEYLMKPPTTTSAVADQQQRQPTDTSSMLSKSTLINTEQDGINSSPSSLDNNVLTPMDTTEESTTTSATKMKKAPSSSLSSLPSNNNASARRDSLLGDDIGSLEAYAESDGIDIKKLTPKERRQLRNKISARNFRVRRKEYITTLEQQVNDHKKHAEGLAERLGMVENENKQLRQEVDTLKRQNLLLQQQQILQPQAC